MRRKVIRGEQKIPTMPPYDDGTLGAYVTPQRRRKKKKQRSKQ